MVVKQRFVTGYSEVGGDMRSEEQQGSEEKEGSEAKGASEVRGKWD